MGRYMERLLQVAIYFDLRITGGCMVGPTEEALPWLA